MRSIELCRRLVAIDSTPSQGNREAVELAMAALRDLGLKVSLFEESHHGIVQANLLAFDGESGLERGSIYLLSHLDTPDPGALSAWSHNQGNPFQLVIGGGYYYGLGVSSGKIDFLCQLEAFSRLDVDVRKRAVMVVAGGFQSGMTGAVRLVRRKILPVGTMIVGAPTGGRPLKNGMGEAMFEVRLPFGEEEQTYRLGHDVVESSATQTKIFQGGQSQARWGLNENPIVRALESLSQLPKGVSIMDLDGGRDARTWPSSASLEIDIVGPTFPTITEKLIALCELLNRSEAQMQRDWDRAFKSHWLHLGCVRTDVDAVRIGGIVKVPPAMIKDARDSWLENIRRECGEIGAEFHVLDFKAGFCSLREGLDPRSPDNLYMGTSEANIFQRVGFDCVLYGPGESPEMCRAADERVSIQNVEESIEFYQRMIKGGIN